MSTAALDLPRVAAGDLTWLKDLVRAVNWPHRPDDVAMLLALGQGRTVRDGDPGAGPNAGPGAGLGVGLWWPLAPGFARLGLIAVAPSHQGRGLGRKIVETLLADTAPRCVMLLATDAGRPLYESLGFAGLGVNLQHQGTYTGEPVADPRARSASPADLAAIVALDASALGVPRKTILGALLSAGQTAVLERNGEIAGYAVERSFGRGAMVGPIVAESEEDAAVLFRAIARPGFVRVDLPAEAQGFGRELERCGLNALTEEAHVMQRGAWPAPTGPARIYGLASHALG